MAGVTGVVGLITVAMIVVIGTMVAFVLTSAANRSTPEKFKALPMADRVSTSRGCFPERLEP